MQCCRSCCCCPIRHCCRCLVAAAAAACCRCLATAAAAATYAWVGPARHSRAQGGMDTKLFVGPYRAHRCTGQSMKESPPERPLALASKTPPPLPYTNCNVAQPPSFGKTLTHPGALQNDLQAHPHSQTTHQVRVWSMASHYPTLPPHTPPSTASQPPNYTLLNHSQNPPTHQVRVWSMASLRRWGM